jgi:hypothetical protein
MVVDGSVPDFKPSTQRFLDRADILVVTSGAPLTWPGVPDVLFRGKPQFRASPPLYESAALTAAVHSHRHSPQSIE